MWVSSKIAPSCPRNNMTSGKKLWYRDVADATFETISGKNCLPEESLVQPYLCLSDGLTWA
jgi:hypothetical protein